MRFFSVVCAPIALLSLHVLAQNQSKSNITIDTPTAPTACQNTSLTWSGGIGPYIISFFPAGAPTILTGDSFVGVEGNSYSWLVKFAPTTNVGINLKDSKGNLGQTAPFLIQGGPGTDVSCLNGAAAGTGSVISVTPTGGSTGGSSAPAASNTKPGSTPTSSGAGATSTAKSGASANVVNLGVTCMLGAAVVAFLL